MVNYPALVATAEKLITKNGQLVTFYRQSQTPADMTKPWRGAGAHNESATIPNVSAVVIPNEEMDDKEAMRRGDATAYVAAGNFVLGSTPEDMVSIDRMTDSDGYTWRVHSVKILNPGGVRVLYIVGLLH